MQTPEQTKFVLKALKPGDIIFTVSRFLFVFDIDDTYVSLFSDTGLHVWNTNLRYHYWECCVFRDGKPIFGSMEMSRVLK